MNGDERINVTKTFLPPYEEYESYLKRIWDSGYLTNQGPLLKQFERNVKEYLGVENFHFVSNGTIALQIALRSLDITDGEVITTPFSYVATTSSILWEKLKPVFADIKSTDFNINPDKIEALITPNTRAIMAVHVFGNPCDVSAIETIAKKHNLKVIYDAAHAFNVTYRSKSIFRYGDVSTCSFHATKLYHTVEGGGIFTTDSSVSEKVELLKRFGHNNDDHIMLGINAKSSELNAAMGLTNLTHIDEIIADRRKISEHYDRLLGSVFMRPGPLNETGRNYAYYPIVFENEKLLIQAVESLNAVGVYPRRYFYPSLNTLEYLKESNSCPVSEDISKRILCLPLYFGLIKKDVDRICDVLLGQMQYPAKMR